MFKLILWQEGIQCLSQDGAKEDDAEKIDDLHIVGTEPGQDLVVTSWASGQQQQVQSQNMEIQLTATAQPQTSSTTLK